MSQENMPTNTPAPIDRRAVLEAIDYYVASRSHNDGEYNLALDIRQRIAALPACPVAECNCMASLNGHDCPVHDSTPEAPQPANHHDSLVAEARNWPGLSTHEKNKLLDECADALEALRAPQPAPSVRVGDHVRVFERATDHAWRKGIVVEADGGMSVLLEPQPVIDVAGLVEEARRYAVKATPGPCQFGYLGVDGEPYTDPQRIKEAMGTMIDLAVEHGDSVRGCFLVTAGDPEDPITVAITGNGPTSEANAQFFAGARECVLKLATALTTLAEQFQQERGLKEMYKEQRDIFKDERNTLLGKLAQAEREMLASAKSTGCYVAVREGGGPENIAASLAVSVLKLKTRADAAEKALAETQTMIIKDIHALTEALGGVACAKPIAPHEAMLEQVEIARKMRIELAGLGEVEYQVVSEKGRDSFVVDAGSAEGLKYYAERGYKTQILRRVLGDTVKPC